jgi:malonate transporter
MHDVISVLLPVFGLIALGYAASLRGWMGPGATSVLNRFVLRLALPVELFQIVVQMPLGQLGHPGFVAAFLLGMGVAFVAGFLLDWRRPVLRDHKLSGAAIEGLSAGYANTAFMGIPILLGLFGERASAPLAIANLLTVCLLMAVVVLLIELENQQGGSGSAAFGKVARGLAGNPMIFAPIAGIVLNAAGVPIPSGVGRMTAMLGGAASPCALVTIGLFLAETRDSPAPFGAVLRIAALKMLVQPAVTLFAALELFGLPTLWVEQALLLSALPTGTAPFMLAELYGREAGVASRATLLTTLLSAVTVGGIIAWIGPNPG